MKPPVYLQPGDTVSVSVNGLGTLENKIADLNSENPTAKQVESISHLQHTNTSRCVNSSMLTQIGNKQLYYKTIGSNTASPIVFIHGLGGTHAHWTPLIYTLGLMKHHSLHLFDLEGHGLSPTSPLCTLSIESFATDLNGIFEHVNIQSGATLIAHSDGCLIAATFALAHPDKIKKMVLISPPPLPVPRETKRILYANAELARTRGMSAVVDNISTAGFEDTKPSTASFLALVQLSLLGQDPEGYAKACAAFARVKTRIAFEQVEAPTLVIVGNDEESSEVYRVFRRGQSGVEHVKCFKGMGLFPSFEDSVDVADAIGDFVS
jgi:pimeloyl-ACP methyl ester carboxylesterase